MRKHALLVYPRFSRNHILNYEGLTPFYPGKQAVMPPLGLLGFGGLLRDRGGFELRLVDENLAPLSPADLDWADLVCVSGMHSQRTRITELIETANLAGKLTVLGGPSVSSCPEYYPQADLLHVGELGDASEALVALLRTGAKPAVQGVFRSQNLLPLEEQPLPAIELADVHRYLSMPLQSSAGCPFRCEFWRFAGKVARLRADGRLASALEVVLRVTPNAHHLITWGEKLLATPPHPQPMGAPAVKAAPPVGKRPKRSRARPVAEQR